MSAKSKSAEIFPKVSIAKGDISLKDTFSKNMQMLTNAIKLHGPTRIERIKN